MSLHFLRSRWASTGGAGRGPCPALAPGNSKKKGVAVTPDCPAIVGGCTEHGDLPSDSPALPPQPKIPPKLSNSRQDWYPASARSANERLGACGGTQMLNTSSMLIYLWLLQPTVTTSNNWIALGIARLICYLIIKPSPLLIMASLETRRSGEKCIQGAMLAPKAHVSLGAEQDLCQMQILYWWQLKHALYGLLCLRWHIYQLWQGCYLAFRQKTVNTAYLSIVFWRSWLTPSAICSGVWLPPSEKWHLDLITEQHQGAGLPKPPSSSEASRV